MIEDTAELKRLLDSHTIEGALRREELDEEEAYFILRYAGRIGYRRAIDRLTGNPFHVWRKWLIWIGGWENPKLSQWDRGKRAWELIGGTKKKYIRSPFPVALFGHRISFQGSLRPSIRTPHGYLCVSGSYCYGWPDKFFWSPDGTPNHPGARMYWRSSAESRGTP